jgi:hypothetical protein
MRIKASKKVYIPAEIDASILLPRWIVLFECGHQTTLIGARAPRPDSDAICWRCVNELRFEPTEKKLD